MSWILAASWQAALVGLVALLAEALRARPGLRQALWLAFAARLLVPPSLESPVGVAPAAAAPDGSWMAPLWLFGVAAGLLLACARARRCRALLRDAVPLAGDLPVRAAARLRMRRPPRVLVGRCGPAVIGVFRPAVVIPRRLVAALAPEELEHVLLHELAHVKRKDLLAHALFGALNVLYWFHPLAWIARRRAYAARELLCDEAVAGALGSARAYRRTLLRAALLAGPQAAGASLLGGGFLARVRALDREPRRRGAWRGLAAAAVALVLVACASPAPFDEARAAREAFARAYVDPEGHGCLETRHLLLRAVALGLEKR